jgi:hypothetical protein
MVQTQPMKMAAAEAMFNSACGADASFSIFSIGTPDGTGEVWSLRVPYVLAFLSTHDFNGCVEGINDLNPLHDADVPAVRRPGGGNFAPILWVTYWSFRWMMGFGLLATAIAVAGLWVTARTPSARRPLDVEDRDLAGAARAVRHPRRLDLHRDGPSALDRVRSDAHAGRRLAERARLDRADLADRLHRDLRDPRGRGVRPHLQDGQGGSAALPGPDDPDPSDVSVETPSTVY